MGKEKRVSLHVVVLPKIRNLLEEIAMESGLTLGQATETILQLGIMKSIELHEERKEREEKKNEC